MSGERYKTSYTMEASFTMAIVLSVTVPLAQSAYRQCKQTNGNIRLQEMVEAPCHRKTMPGDFLALDTVPYQIEVERGVSRTGGRIEGGNWNPNIENNIYRPKELMRLLTLIQEWTWG